MLDRCVKSYVLSRISSQDVSAAARGSLRPGQRDPWLLKGAQGDAVAYFNICPSDTAPIVSTISVDITGRYTTIAIQTFLPCWKSLERRSGGDISRSIRPGDGANRYPAHVYILDD
jgi:hypothetical protein